MALRRARAVIVPIAAWCAVACNALSGIDDLGASDEGVAASDASAGDVIIYKDAGHQHDAAADAGTVSVLDASDTSASAATLCAALSMVIPFDGTGVSAQGDAPTVIGVPGAFVPGKFGQALAFTDAAAELDYDARSGARVSATEGTLSMWIDSSTWELPCTKEHDFFSVDDGVYMDCEPTGILGVYVDMTSGDTVTAAIPSATGKGAWTAGYNHLVATWSASAPGFRILLNGKATSSTMSDWAPPRAIAKTLYLGADGFGPAAALDDVAVWKRALSPDEIAAIYAAGRPVAEICGIK